jgi:uncharacterized protein YbjT (DUF2867 family)
MTILVTGATGKIAHHLIPLLVDDGRSVRAMVHSRDKEPCVQRQGAETAVASFDDPRSLELALQGVETVLLLTPPHPRAAEWASTCIALAKETGIKRIVRISAILAGPNGPSDNNRQHGRTDDEIRRSGIAYVILRPHFFMQNLLADIDTLKSENVLQAAAGTAKLGMIDVRDIADVAKCALIDARWDGNAYDLTGPASISFEEIVHELSDLLRRPINYVPITPKELAQKVREMGLDEWSAQSFHDYLQAYGEGWGDFTTDAVETISGHRARSFSQFAEEVFLPALSRLESAASTERLGSASSLHDRSKRYFRSGRTSERT